MFQMMPAKVLNGNVVIGRKQKSRVFISRLTHVRKKATGTILNVFLETLSAS